jgi:phage/plasmid-like protein (TIGR03299 family)
MEQTMSANLDYSNGRVNFAFTGDRADIWHHEGNQMQAGQSINDWIETAGLAFKAIRTPAFTQLPDGSMKAIPDWTYLTRSDTLTQLGYVSTAGYKEVQPDEPVHCLAQYTGIDDRFQLETAGSLNGGKRVWAAATFQDGFVAGGAEHKARLLCTTSFDGTSATWFKCIVTKVVCQNTLEGALAEKSAAFRVFHSVKFDRVAAGKQLAKIAAGFAKYRVMADAMALVHFSETETDILFKKLLEIPQEAASEDISTRKLNQFRALADAYKATVDEGTETGTVWTALNAVTRYVDHNRASRGGDSASSARFDSSLFGSGAAMKADAWNLLAPLVRDRVAA